MSRQYLIDEELLIQLIADSHRLSILEQDGVDNWQWCMEGRNDYLVDCMRLLPWNEGLNEAGLRAIIREEDYDVEDLARDELDAFWEPYHERCGAECQFNFKQREGD